MSVKDKVILLLIILLMIGCGYIYYTYTQVVERMEVMEQQQYTHIEEVNKQFRNDLDKLDLQFIGRGKHLQTAQQNIRNNRGYIGNVSDSLGASIEDNAFNLDEVARDLDKQISDVDQDLGDLQADVSSERRRTTRKLTDMEQNLSNLKSSLESLETLSIIQKAREKDKK